ncbi:MAG: hypothetical protein WCI67_22420 [Chloroflexales bacterium]
MIDRRAMQARDTRPEDVDDTAITMRMTNAIRRAAGRSPMVVALIDAGDEPDEPDMTMADEPDEPAMLGMADEPETDEEESDTMMSDVRFTSASAMIDRGEPRQAVRLVLQDDHPEPMAVHYAIVVLRDVLGADVLAGPGYEQVATLLSLQPNPDAGARDAAAMTLLALDGPGDAHDAGVLMEAEGRELAELTARMRVRAGLPPRTGDGQGPALADEQELALPIVVG